ncbi:IS5/IS1182 family transposase [Streptomyces sp. T1317-0309]|nr:IS5/IS1182 family transposase [Streptomyces sp. T1317-0309]
MSLRARSYQRIPTRTVLTAWAACPKGTPAMVMRDLLDVVFEDEEFADLFPKDGRPGLSPGQLALVSVLQFAENLSDRAAANAVRTRIDWKYALGLELDDSGFDHSVLCEFRARLAEADAADRLLQVMLRRLTEAGLLTSGGRQRTDATHVLAAVRTLSRLELVGESLRAALEKLAQADPDWLLPLVEPEWDKRYGRKVEIGKVPGGKAGVTALAEAFGRDGQKVLAAAWAADAPPRLRTLTQVEIRRRVWVHHYYWDARGRLRWRDGHALPPASLRFDSPYDTDAHYCVKRDTAWSGYRTHFTETCTSELPEVVVHVATTIAPVQDGELTAQIHDALAAMDLTPAEHAVDAAYVSPTQIERAQRVHGITLLGPSCPTTVTKPKAEPGSTRPPSGSTGTTAAPPAPRATSAASGGPCVSADTTTSRSSSTRPPAWPAPSAQSAPTPSAGRAHSRCYPPANYTRSSSTTVSTSTLSSGSAGTRSAPASKPPSLRTSAPAACAEPATEACPRRTSSTY